LKARQRLHRGDTQCRRLRPVERNVFQSKIGVPVIFGFCQRVQRIHPDPRLRIEIGVPST